MNRNKLFNPDGDQDFSKRKIIKGNSTNLFELNNIKYDWAYRAYKIMLGNFWIPDEIPLGKDSKDYENILTDAERLGYDRVISFLVFLDSIQTANLPNFSDYITAPEVNLCLAVQTYQEAIHSQSYGYILDSVVSADKRSEIYNLWREDENLKNRTMLITEVYQNFKDNPNDKNFVLSLFGNYLLEGLYFYSGFSFFYALARQGKMSGTAQEIRYIQRDEVSHLYIFQNIIKEVRNENKGLIESHQDEIMALIDEAVQTEIRWGQYVVDNKIIGLSNQVIEDFIHYIIGLRLNSVDLPNPYPKFDKNPLSWFDDFGSVNRVKVDFFEAKPTDYSKSSGDQSWDDF